MNNVLIVSKLLEILFFCNPESNLSTAKENFLDQKIFPQSKTFHLIKEIFYSPGNFPQESWPGQFSTKKFSTKNLIKEIFHGEGNFLQKSSLKTKVLDAFDTKSPAKIYLAL